MLSSLRCVRIFLGNFSLMVSSSSNNTFPPTPLLFRISKVFFFNRHISIAVKLRTIVNQCQGHSEVRSWLFFFFQILTGIGSSLGYFSNVWGLINFWCLAKGIFLGSMLEKRILREGSKSG